MNNSHQLAEHLHAQGLRLTPQRLAILHILSQSGKHLTPAEIYDRAQQELPGITEATVYRTLSFLAQQGLALPAYIGNGQFIYEYAGHNHHHLICRACGQSREVDHQALENLYQQFQETTGFHIDSVHMTFFGLCPDCQKENLETTG